MPGETATRCSPTAAELFAEHGVDVSLEEIARKAGVGIGTLYRNFPTRDALIADVYRREVDQLCDGVDELLERAAAGEALEEWMRRFVSYVATKRGMAAALKSVVGADSELFADSRVKINDAMARLVRCGGRRRHGSPRRQPGRHPAGDERLLPGQRPTGLAGTGAAAGLAAGRRPALRRAVYDLAARPGDAPTDSLLRGQVRTDGGTSRPGADRARRRRRRR